MPKMTANPQAEHAPPEEQALDEARWHLVRERQRPRAAPFYYAVRTTGVFCRPGCASRLPRRDNVVFFETAEAARASGYRACLRCKPEREHERDAGLTALLEACRLLSSDGASETREVARALGFSAGYFQRFFKARLGVTPQQYRRRVRAERARGGLGRAQSVTELVYDSGFASSSQFYASVGQELGMPPGKAHRGAPGELIRYVLRPCSLGHLLIAWTARGVCQVDFSDTPESLLPRLRDRFPGAELVATEADAWATGIIRAVERPTALSVPLDIRGTAFQERVWRALASIPPGETRTYAEIARAVGQPSAARAVGTACAANPLAFVVPCHRVVRSNGTVSGYRWDVRRKEELLRRESVACEPHTPCRSPR